MRDFFLLFARLINESANKGFVVGALGSMQKGKKWKLFVMQIADCGRRRKVHFPSIDFPLHLSSATSEKIASIYMQRCTQTINNLILDSSHSPHRARDWNSVRSKAVSPQDSSFLHFSCFFHQQSVEQVTWDFVMQICVSIMIYIFSFLVHLLTPCFTPLLNDE